MKEIIQVLADLSTLVFVVSLGAAQRNIAAAMVMATGNFGNDPNVLTMFWLEHC